MSEQWRELFDDIYQEDAAECRSDLQHHRLEQHLHRRCRCPATRWKKWLLGHDQAGRRPRRRGGRAGDRLRHRHDPLPDRTRAAELYMGIDVSAEALALCRKPARPPGDLKASIASRVRLRPRPADDARRLRDRLLRHSDRQLGGAVLPERRLSRRGRRARRSSWCARRRDLPGRPAQPAAAGGLPHLAGAVPGGAGDTALIAWRQKVRARRLHENELAVDPAFFFGLGGSACRGSAGWRSI